MKLRFLLSLIVIAAWVLPAAAQNPGVIEVKDPSVYTSVVAISDVHGEYEHARTLLRNAHIVDGGDHWMAGKALMVVVGDSIDKGPKSVEVLQFWMRLRSEAAVQGGQLIVLLGNHEAEFLADPQNHKAKATRADVEALHIPLTDLTDPARPLGTFLRSLPLAARIGDWVFCHAGWVPDEPWASFAAQAHAALAAGKYDDPLLAADDSILETKNGPDGKKWWRSQKDVKELERRLDADGLAGVILGHQPSALGVTDDVGESADGRIVKVDSGMAPPSSGGGAAESDDGSGQPYKGHLLVIPNPRAMIGRNGGAVRFLSVASDGSQKSAPKEIP